MRWSFRKSVLASLRPVISISCHSPTVVITATDLFIISSIGLLNSSLMSLTDRLRRALEKEESTGCYFLCFLLLLFFRTLFYQHKHLHRRSGVIIGLPRVYCGVGKTVFIGRLADPLDLRLPSASDFCN